MADLHLVASGNMAGVLKGAFKKQLLTGEVFAINDIPGLGPLEDGVKRMTFLRGLRYEKEGINWSGRDTDAFAPWRQLVARLSAQPVDRLVIWAREYEDIVSHPGMLRECDEKGVLQFLELSAHDDHILAMCTRRWNN